MDETVKRLTAIPFEPMIEEFLIGLRSARDSDGKRYPLTIDDLMPILPEICRRAVAAHKAAHALPPELRGWSKRVEDMARSLCARYHLDPDAEIVFGPPQYFGVDVCYPIAFYVPHEDQRRPLWMIFSRQAELVLATIDAKTQSTPSKDDQ